MLKGQIKVTKENLLQLIENYPWMVETIEEARQPVAKAYNNSYIGAKTAMYGIEATLPKASGGTSDPVYTEVQRRVYSLKIIELRSMSKRLRRYKNVFH